MVAWKVTDFGGLIPRRQSRLLPDQMAEQAANCDLSSGQLDGLPVPELITNLGPTAQRAYRYPLAGSADVWLALIDPLSSVVRSPLANDTNHRLYWTNPSNTASPGAWWNTRARIAAGDPPYNLGTIHPDPGIPLDVSASGGTPSTTVPFVERSYVYTLVNEYGEESAPSAPSAVIAGASDGTWTINGMPTGAPSNPPGYNYPAITKARLYRTVTGGSSGAAFYQAVEFDFAVDPPTDPYLDTSLDADIVGGEQLITASWANPPATLDGLTALPGGMLVGFSGATVHFCEPNRPHTWPAGYDQSLHYEIVGFGVWQQSLIALTRGFPSSGSGNSPSNYVFTTIQVAEPCISRGSIVTDMNGVQYASQNGLITLSYFGMKNTTQALITKNTWLNDYKADQIISCRHRAQYLAVRQDGSGQGFLIDPIEERLGLMPLASFTGVTSIWNDEYSGDAYLCAGGVIYRWDSPSTPMLTYRWRSKQFYGPTPVNIAAMHVSADPAISTVLPDNTNPLDTGDPTLVLPPGVNALIRVYAGQNGQYLLLERNLTLAREIFSLPSGIKAYDWQFEIVSRVGIRSAELATSMRELRQV